MYANQINFFHRLAWYDPVLDRIEPIIDFIENTWETCWDLVSEFLYNCANFFSYIPLWFQSIRSFLDNINIYVSEIWSNLNFMLSYMGWLKQIFRYIWLYLPYFIALSAAIFLGVQVVKAIFGRN